MSLRIPLTVKRCARRDTAGRVLYEHDEECLIPEQIVLRRWKARSKEDDARSAGIRFDGCRLPSGTWTLLRQWMEEGLPTGDLTKASVLNEHAERNRTLGGKLRTPVSTKFALMLGYLEKKKVLREIVARRRAVDTPGLPDLFLYRVDREGRVLGGRFVEVKRQGPTGVRERLSSAQKEELVFLRSLGLKARVVYLLETM